jgi:hypothetical protein
MILIALGGLLAATACEPAPPVSNYPPVAIIPSPSETGNGYLVVASDGGVFTFGDAVFGGSTGATNLQKPVVGAAPHKGGGYWLVAADGGVFSFGGAPFFGSEAGAHLNQPIVGMAPTPSGNGYWLVAADGGVFTHGDAPFLGSLVDSGFHGSVVGIAASPAGGYWLAATDGGVFTFGTPFFGSMGNKPLNQPVTSIAATADGGGYWLLGKDGGVFSFGNAGFFGTVSAPPPAQPPAAPTPLRQQIVDLAFSQLGVHETGRPNCIEGNPYSSNCVPWCSSFASWVWGQAGVDIPITPFSGNMWYWSAAHAVTRPATALPKPGDVQLIGTGPRTTSSSTHVTIVVAVRANGQIQTIGGNERDAVRFSDWHTPTGHYGYASPVAD